MADSSLEAGGTPPSALPTPPRRPWRRFVLLGLVLIAGAYFGLRWLAERRQYETTDDATLAGDVIPVTSELAGKVTAVNVSENDAVQAGQLLVTLDPRPFEIALARAKADLHVAQQQAAASASGVVLAHAQAPAQA